MAISLQILVEGIPFDLFKGEEERFYISKQIFDLRNLETRNAEFSKGVDLPLSPTNLEILGVQLPTKNRFDDSAFAQIPCEVLISGIPVITDAYLLVGPESITDKKVSITVYGGTAKFFNELKDISIKDLDWSDMNMVWDLAGIEAVRGAQVQGNGMQILNAQWYSNPSRRIYEFSSNSNDAETFLNQQEIGEIGFFMPIREICERIWAEMDLEVFQNNINHTPGGGSDNNSLYRESSIACRVDIIHDSFTAIEGSYTEARPEAELFAGLNPDPIRLQMLEIVDPDGIFDDPTNQFIIITAGFYSIRLTVNGQHSRSLNLSFSIRANVGLAGERVLSTVLVPPTSGGNVEPYTASTSTSITAEVGDTIGAYIQLDAGQLYSVDVFASGEFVAEQSGAGRGRDLTVAEWIPDISQRDFVKNVFNWLGVVPTEENNLVTLDYFQEIKDTKSIAKTLDLDQSRPIQAVTSFVTYGQDNKLLYTIPDSLERDDTDDSFPVNSLTLARVAIAIEVLFNPTDQAVSRQGLSPRACIPAYDLDWTYVTDNKMKFTVGSSQYETIGDRNSIQAGDFIAWDSGGGSFVKRRITIIDDDFKGQMDVASPSNTDQTDWHHWKYNKKEIDVPLVQMQTAGDSQVTLQDGGLFNPVENTNIAFFETRALWSEIKALYFPLLIDSVFKPFVIEAWMSLPAVQFADIHLNEMVFLEDYDAYFYVNIIEQWKNSGSCRVVFVQLDV